MDPNDVDGWSEVVQHMIEAATAGGWGTAVPNPSEATPPSYLPPWGGVLDAMLRDELDSPTYYSKRGIVSRAEAAEEAQVLASPQDKPQDSGKKHLLSVIRTLEGRVEKLEKANRELVFHREQAQADHRRAVLEADRAKALLEAERAKVHDRERSIVSLTLQVQDLRWELESLRSRPSPSGARKLNLGTSEEL